MPLRMLCGAVAGFTMLAATSGAIAETWPSRPITVVSRVAAGNAGDLVARVVLEQVTRQIGEAFVIENRVGGGGVVASASVAHAEPDGYTALLLSSSEGSSVVMHNTLTYDPVRDLVPVVMFGVQPNVLVVAPSRGWHTVKDLVAAAKAAPGKLNFASAGIGSASHWAAARLNLATGIQTQHIPFRGAEGLNELIAGRIDYYFVPLAPAVVNIKSGRVLPLAVSTPKRSPALPNVPTVADAGYPDAQYLFWGGLAMPAKTPRAIIDRLHDEVQKALNVPEVQGRLATLGVEPMPVSVDEFGKFFRKDVAATVELAKAINLIPTN